MSDHSTTARAIEAATQHASVSDALDAGGIGAALTVVADDVERHPVGGTEAVEYDFTLPIASGPTERSRLTVRNDTITHLNIVLPAISAEDLTREEATDRAERVLRDMGLYQSASVVIDTDTAENEHSIILTPFVSQEPADTIDAIKTANRRIVEEFGLS